MAILNIIGLTTITVLIASALAAPALGSAELAPRQAIVQPLDSASCVIGHIENTNLAEYDVHVGRPYNGGSGCGDIYNALIVSVAVNQWKCLEDEAHAGTVLHFVTGDDRDSNDAIVAGLQVAYPTLPFQGQGICFKGYSKRFDREPPQDDLAPANNISTTTKDDPENPWCNWDGNDYLSMMDVSVGVGIDGVSKEFCAAHHGVIKAGSGNTHSANIYQGMSVLLNMINFCDGVEITEQECIDDLWTAGNSCKDNHVYPDGVHMYGGTYISDCAGYAVVPIPAGSRAEPPELFKCYNMTCVPGPAGDEQCRNSSSHCANGCSSGGKCVA